MNEMVANHQNIVSEKDKQLVEYQKQIEALQKAEQELSKQIEEQKAKNNVRTQIFSALTFLFSPSLSLSLYLNSNPTLIFRQINCENFFLSLQTNKKLNSNQTRLRYKNFARG
jgi:hypothetical protein